MIGVGFKVLMSMAMRNTIFWNVTLCSLVEVTLEQCAAIFMLSLLINSEDGDTAFHQSVCGLVTTVPYIPDTVLSSEGC
jgi:hypothetical protein